MKNLNELLKEGRQITFNVAFNDFVDNEGLPIGVNIIVDQQYASQFDEFLAKEEANIFAHAGGMTTEY